jgi:hypothetical protein
MPVPDCTHLLLVGQLLSCSMLFFPASCSKLLCLPCTGSQVANMLNPPAPRLPPRRRRRPPRAPAVPPACPRALPSLVNAIVQCEQQGTSCRGFVQGGHGWLQQGLLVVHCSTQQRGVGSSG